MKRKITRFRQSVFGIGPLILALLIMCGSQRVMAQALPVISNVTPLVGIPGSGAITITGSGFNDTADRNIVLFGGAQATVTAATPTSLTVTVPVGAVYSNVSVMNRTSRLTGYAADFFLPTFNAAPYIPFSRGFRPKVDLATTNALVYMAVSADVDGDGKTDLVVSTYDTAFGQTFYSSIDIYRNTGSGGVISYAAPVACTVAYGARNIKLADLDADGKLDIVAATSGNGVISILRNLSTPGTVSMSGNFRLALGSGAYETAIADFDGDGKLDVAAVEYQKDSVILYRNIISTIPVAAFTTNGTFTHYHVDYRVGDGPVSIAAADIDGDGKPDMVISNNSSNNISIMKNISIIDSFMFQPAVNVAAGDGPQQVIAANINNDGKPDIVISNYNNNSLLIYRNQSLSGLFTLATLATPVEYNIGNGGNGITVGDLDADGKMDIAVSKFLADSFTILRNTTTGSVIDGTSFTVDSSYFLGFGHGPLGITIADVDGDTKADIITANNSNSTISIFESFELPDASTINGPDSVCAGSNATYTSTHGAGAVGSWSVTNNHATIVGGTGANDTSATLTGVSAGVDTIIYRVIYLSDTNTFTKVVVINPLPSSGAITGPTQVCDSSTITLANPTAGAGYWMSTDTTIASVDSATGVVTGRAPGGVTINYTATSFSCGTTTSSHPVTVLALPDAGTIGGPGGTCVGTSITLTASVAGGTWLNQYPVYASHTPAGVNDVITGLAVGADTIMYFVTTATCGNDTAIHSVGVIEANHSLPIKGDTSICLGTINTLTNAATGGVWTSGNPLVATVDPFTGAVTGVTVGSATIFYVVTYGCGPIDTFITVNVVPGPVVNPIADQTVCNGFLLTIPLSSPTPGVSFAWTNSNPTIGLAASGTSNPIAFIGSDTAIGGNTGVINVTATSNGCTGAPETFNATVNPTATLTSSTAPASVCSGSTFTYVSTSDRPGTIFTWHRNAVTGVSNPVASGSGNISEALVNTTTDSVMVIYVDTLNYNGCKTLGNISVYVKATPLLVSTMTLPICDSSVFVFTPSSATGGATFNWTRPTVAGISNPTASGTGGVTEWLNNTTVNPVTVTYLYTTTASGCSGSQNVFVIVQPTAVLSSTLDAGEICDSTLFTYIPTSATAGATFTWTRDSVDGITSAAGSGSDTVSEYLFNTTNAPIVVTYEFVTDINGCADTQLVTVTVKPRAYLTSDLTPPGICSEDFFNYNPTSNIAATGVIFSWTRATVLGISNLPGSGVGNPNEMLINTSSTFVDVPYVFTTTYQGCSYMQTVTVRVQPKPILVGATHDTVCSGTPFSYTPTAPFTGISYAWTRAAVTGITPDTASGTVSINETLNNSTLTRIDVIYVYTLTANGCTYTQNFILTVDPRANPTPIITTHAPSSVCLNTMYQNFGAEFTPADSVIEYAWSTRNATIFATGSSSQYALVNFTTPGTALVVLNSNVSTVNCVTSDTFVVNVSSTPAPEPVVYYLNKQFVCLPADMDSYQWGYDNEQLDSTILTGETNQDYINPTPEGGKYYWCMTTKGDCFQKTYANTPTAITNVNMDNIAMKLYPNPTSAMLTIEVNNTLSGDVEVQLFNMVGQVVGTAKVVDNKAVFSVSDFASGSYLVACYRNGVKVAASRFIKN